MGVKSVVVTYSSSRVIDSLPPESDRDSVPLARSRSLAPTVAKTKIPAGPNRSRANLPLARRAMRNEGSSPTWLRSDALTGKIASNCPDARFVARVPFGGFLDRVAK
jgi:hypothetical protein